MRCLFCGTTDNVQIHHSSYDPPEIIPLCIICHQKVHSHGVGKTSVKNLGKLGFGYVRVPFGIIAEIEGDLDFRTYKNIGEFVSEALRLRLEMLKSQRKGCV